MKANSYESLPGTSKRGQVASLNLSQDKNNFLSPSPFFCQTHRDLYGQTAKGKSFERRAQLENWVHSCLKIEHIDVRMSKNGSIVDRLASSNLMNAWKGHSLQERVGV